MLERGVRLRDFEPVLVPSPALSLPGTKAARPRLPSDHVDRERLIRTLDQGLERRLTLVSAPGGFGKTTLLSAWNPPGWAVIWLSLDETDDDLHRFGFRLVEAIRRLEGDALGITLSLLNLMELPSPGALASRLAAELSELHDRFVIVLDDYHLIHADEIHRFLGQFVTRISDNLHLVIATRETPPLPVATLRARGQLAEVRLDQLAFTADEAREFLDQAVPILPVGNTAERIVERTDGWAAGHRLAAVAMVNAAESTVLPVNAEARSFQYMRDFLLDDVLMAQPPDVQDLLLRCSVLDRFCIPLLDALADTPAQTSSSAEALEVIKRGNLFITALDAEGDWYRLHHLFRDALRQLLARRVADYPATLHRRASDWYASQNLIEDAIRHALAAGDPGHAARLIEEHIHPQFDRDDSPYRIEAWLRLLPPEVADASAAVVLVRAWLYRLRNRMGELPVLLRTAEALLNEDTTRDEPTREALRGTIDALWAYYWYGASDLGRLLESSERAVNQVPTQWRFARGETELIHAAALAMVGREQDAHAFLAACRATTTHIDGQRLALILVGQARFAHLNLGHRELTRAATELLDLARASQLSRPFIFGHVFAALAHYGRNDLYDARDHFLAARGSGSRQGMAMTVDSALGLAATLQALGDDDPARTILRELAAVLEDVGSVAFLTHLRSCEARLALARGDVDEAGRQLRMIPFDQPIALPSLVEVPEVTHARWLLLQGTSASLQDVADIVERLRQQATIRRHVLANVRAESVQALLLQARGDTEAAIDCLRQIVALTRPGELIRHYVDLGPPMQRLLVELDRWISSSDPYVTRILAAFPPPGGPPVSVAPPRRVVTEPPAVDALSWREIEVLERLDARLSNKEIARALHISTETVKKHTSSIYQKLQVRKRRDAVSRAYLLRLLPVTREAPEA